MVLSNQEFVELLHRKVDDGDSIDRRQPARVAVDIDTV
jgi:hypothetical protein